MATVTNTHRKRPRTRNTQISNNGLLQGVLKEVEQYEKASIFETKVAEAWNALGLIRFYVEKDNQEAIKCFEKAISIHKHPSSSSSAIDLAVTLSDLAKCYERLEDLPKALNLFQEVVGVLEQHQVSEAHPALASGRRSIMKLAPYVCA